MYYRYFWLIFLLASCAPIDPAPVTFPDSAPQATPSQRDFAIEPSQRPNNLSASAVTQLLEQAEQLYEAGEYRRSIAVTERAMRLNRYIPGVFWMLALNHLSLESYGQAEQFAQQGLSLAGERAQAKYNFSALLKQIRAAVDEN